MMMTEQTALVVADCPLLVAWSLPRLRFVGNSLAVFSSDSAAAAVSRLTNVSCPLLEENQGSTLFMVSARVSLAVDTDTAGRLPCAQSLLPPTPFC